MSAGLAADQANGNATTTSQLEVNVTAISSANANSEPGTQPEAQGKASNETIIPEDAPNPRTAALAAKKLTLEATLHDLLAQRTELVNRAIIESHQLAHGKDGVDSEPTEVSSGEEKLATAMASSNATIKSHINLLHKYNEIKDIGQRLMGLIADSRDCRVVDVMEEFEIGAKD